MFDKVKEITDGWYNLVFPSEEIKAIATSRAIQCADCTLNKNNICSSTRQGQVVKDFSYHGEPRKAGEIRSGCSCILSAKTHSEQSICPLGKWLEINK